MKKITLSLFAITVLLFSGCAKDPIPGPAGKDGTNGTNGNANVISTNTVTVTPAQWTYDSANELYYVNIEALGITQAIVDKGAVQVFQKAGNMWYAIHDATTNNVSNYVFGLGNVMIINKNIDNTTPPLPTTSTFRILIIAASN